MRTVVTAAAEAAAVEAVVAEAVVGGARPIPPLLAVREGRD